MPNKARLTKEQEKKILISADQFSWETFSHKPLNVFDIGPWVLCFPGNISEDRDIHPSSYAGFQFNIDDLSSCPRYYDPGKTMELWNEASQEVSWLLGREDWSCKVDAEGFVLITGDCRVGVSVSRFRNIEGVSDLMVSDDLRVALFSQVDLRNKNHGFKPVSPLDCFKKVIEGRQWVVVKSRNALNSPLYSAATPLDYRTAVTAEFRVGSAWFDDEEIPVSVEEKYVESFWDFLSKIQITPSSESDAKPGATEPSDSGQVAQATKEEKQDFQW